MLSWKKSALVWSEILRLFVNTLTADKKYSRCNVHHFAQQVQTPLSKTKISEMWMKFNKNKRLFVDFSLHFGNVDEIYNILKKKDEYPSLIISEIMDC